MKESKLNRRTIAQLVLAASTLVGVGSASAVVTWVGAGGDDKVSNPANFSGPLDPGLDGDAYAETDVTFGAVDDGASTSPDLDNAQYFEVGTPSVNGLITITADAPSYTFTSSGVTANAGGGWGVRSSGSSGGNVGYWINNSPNVQTFDGSFYLYRGVLQNNGGDIIFTENSEFNPGADSTASGRWAGIEGSGNFYFNGQFYHKSATNSNTGGGAFYISAGGEVHLGDLGTQYNGPIIIDTTTGGRVIPEHANAFAGSDSGRTQIRGGATGNGIVQLKGGITIESEVLQMEGRTGDDNAFTPHIQNVSGTNTLNGTLQALSADSGSNVNIDVQSGLLRLGGAIQNPQNSDRNLRLTSSAGANGLIYDNAVDDGGIVQGSSAGRTWQVVIDGEGVWTNESVLNHYIGSTNITEGSTYVMNGQHTDLSEQGGGKVGDYTVDGTLKGNGLIAADITVNGTIAPGASIGQMDITGDLIVPGLWEVEYDGLSNTIDRIDVTGLLDLTGGTFSFVDLGGGDTLDDPAYILATYGSLEGTPSELNVPAGYSVNYAYNGNNIALVVPEPATLSLMAFGALGLRRRRSVR